MTFDDNEATDVAVSRNPKMVTAGPGIMHQILHMRTAEIKLRK
jgi:hypothetical protein